MPFQDTVAIIKNTILSPVPIVNTALFLGMNEADWDLVMKVLIGFASLVWTCAKIYIEIKKARQQKDI